MDENQHIANNSAALSSWNELMASLELAKEHPLDTAWTIFRYFRHNYKEMGSQQVRTLLAIYMKIPVKRPSLIHSCMLGMAVKISSEYADFRFPQFLQMWGYPKMMMKEHYTRQKGKNGRMYLSLREKTERCLQSYMLHHKEGTAEAEGIMTMYAVKVFEKSDNGRRQFFVKLVGADGKELSADSHFFPCKPWEIQGLMFDVLTRTSKLGNLRAEEIVTSKKRMEDVFPPVVGYLDYVDLSHGHYHIYDSLSRHFVAEKPLVTLKEGDFVIYSPIIPAKDKFKSAAVISVMSSEEGRKAFGTYTAEVTYVNKTDGYFHYRITSTIAESQEATVAQEGFAALLKINDETVRASLSVGDTVSLLLFLKRGKDGIKRNHVAKAVKIK